MKARLVKALAVFVLGLCCGVVVAVALFPYVSKVRARAMLRQSIRSSEGLRSEALLQKTVVAIAEYYDERLLLGTAEDGLWEFDRVTRGLKRVAESSGKPTTGAVACILVGKDSILVGNYTGEEYWLTQKAVIQGSSGYAPYYGGDVGPNGEYLAALWRGVALARPVGGKVGPNYPEFVPLLLQNGVTSAVFLENDGVAWCRSDGTVFRGKLKEDRIVEVEQLPSLPAGQNTLVWFAARRVLMATHGRRSFILEGGLWRPVSGRFESPLRVLGCTDTLGQGCWVFSAKSLGVLGPDGQLSWVFEDFPVTPLSVFADHKRNRVYVGTVGAGLVSFPLRLSGQQAAE